MPPKRTPANRAVARITGEEDLFEPEQINMQETLQEMRQQAATDRAAIREIVAEELHRIRAEATPVPSPAPEFVPPPPPPPYHMAPERAILGVKFSHFTNQRTPHFPGGKESHSAHSWLCRVEKDLHVIDVNREFWVPFATHLLTDAAEDWWAAKFTTLEEPITWETFVKEFNDRFYPEWIRHDKEMEFLQLTQGSSSVVKYEEKFTELMRFVPHLVATEEATLLKFIRGLHPELMYDVEALSCRTFREAVGKAITYEKKKAAEHAANLKGQTSRDPHHNKRRREDQRPQIQNQRPARRTRDGVVICFKCNQPGHYARECPQRIAINPQPLNTLPAQLAIAASPHQQAQEQRGPDQKRPAQNQNRRQPVQGRVFALNQAQAEQQPNLVQEEGVDQEAAV